MSKDPDIDFHGMPECVHHVPFDTDCPKCKGMRPYWVERNATYRKIWDEAYAETMEVIAEEKMSDAEKIESLQKELISARADANMCYEEWKKVKEENELLRETITILREGG